MTLYHLEGKCDKRFAFLLQTSMSARCSAPVLRSVKTPREATTVNAPPDTGKWATATSVRLRVRTVSAKDIYFASLTLQSAVDGMDIT